MATRQGPHQGFLHQIVRPDRVAEQRSGITPKFRDLLCDQVFGI
jgi:hypothetical protein